MDLIDEAVAEPGSTPSEEELAEFKAQVAEWVKIDDQIKKLRVAIRERIVHQKALSSKIQTFMKRFNYDNLNTGQGRISNKVREVKEPLKVKDVKTKIYDILQHTSSSTGSFDDDTVRRIHDIFEGERPVVKKEALKRVIPKVSLHIDL